MENEALEKLGQVAGIGGLSIGLLIFVFREVIRTKVFPKLTRKQAYQLLTLIVVLTWIAGIAGLFAWYRSEITRGKPQSDPLQRGSLNGRVVDSATQEAIPDTKVSLMSTGPPEMTFTDGEGVFLFDLPGNLRHKSVRLRFEAPDYIIYELLVALDGRQTTQPVQLNRIEVRGEVDASAPAAETSFRQVTQVDTDAELRLDGSFIDELADIILSRAGVGNSNSTEVSSEAEAEVYREDGELKTSNAADQRVARVSRREGSREPKVLVEADRTGGQEEGERANVPQAVESPSYVILPLPIDNVLYLTDGNLDLAERLDYARAGNWIGNNRLEVRRAAAFEGNYGLRVVLYPSDNSAYVEDSTPDEEYVYRASFWINVNQVRIDSDSGLIVFAAYAINADDRPLPQFGVRLLGIPGDDLYKTIHVDAFGDTGALVTPGPFFLDQGWHQVELEWATVGSSKVEVRFWVNREFLARIVDLENTAARVDMVRLGLIQLIGNGALGSLDIDSFESFRTLRP